MTTRDHAPLGAPCWADLWTSDVDGSRRFYGDLLGWTAEEPNPEFGGYFSFLRDGQPVAGCMGDMGDMKANDTWKPYFATDDVERVAKACTDGGGTLLGPAMPVGDLGIQAVMLDPSGAEYGAWQPVTFAGFATVGEDRAPSWFELHTRDHAGALTFYGALFGWRTDLVSDVDEFRYAVVHDPEGGEDVAGLMDNRLHMPEGTPARWDIYWEVDDIDAAVDQAQKLGGKLDQGVDDTPYGKLAGLTDPAGAPFKLRSS